MGTTVSQFGKTIDLDDSKNAGDPIGAKANDASSLGSPPFDLEGAADGDVPTYDAAANKFKPKQSTIVQVLAKTTLLTDAQIKGLPTAAVEVFPATDPGKQVVPLCVHLLLDSSSGAYENLGTLSTTGSINYKSDGSIAGSVAMDEGTQQFLGRAARQTMILPAFFGVSITQEVFGIENDSSLVGGSPLYIQYSNLNVGPSSAGNFTGGHVDNLLAVTIVYILVGV